MKKILALFIALLALVSCSDKQQPAKPSTPLEQFVDSIIAVYPNYKGNIAVTQKIGADFERHLKGFPGFFEGSKFRLLEIASIEDNLFAGFSLDGKTSAGLTSLAVYCRNIDKDVAVTLDKTKLYKITGGTIEEYEKVSGMAEEWLKLGAVYVKDLTVEEVDTLQTE